MTVSSPAESQGKAADRLIVALDFAAADEARRMADRLAGKAGVFKIGLELIYADGLPLVSEFAKAGQQVFLDAKLLDIPNTVERAAANAASLGASFLTVHGTDRKTLDAAIRGRADSGMKLLAITVLTSLDKADLEEQSTQCDVAELVVKRAALARDAGFDGVVASAQEAGAIREIVGENFLIVTPGIRPPGAAVGDQARIVSPAQAIEAGANYIVVGRPITASPNPGEAAALIIGEIEKALHR